MREWAKKEKKRRIERTSEAGQERERASREIQWLRDGILRPLARFFDTETESPGRNHSTPRAFFSTPKRNPRDGIIRPPCVFSTPERVGFKIDDPSRVFSTPERDSFKIGDPSRVFSTAKTESFDPSRVFSILERPLEIWLHSWGNYPANWWTRHP